MKRNFVIGILLLLAAVVIVGLVLILNKKESPTSTVSNEDEWVSYRNEEYSFTLKHPPEWTVYVQDEEGKEPIINIYPSSVEDRPPFTHHSNVPNVSIFPKGVPTEGVIGMTATSTVSFEDLTRRAVDYVLDTGERWGTFAVFVDHPPTWEDYGFIWARTLIIGHTQTCLDSQGTEIPVERCHELGEVGLTLEDKGVIDQDEKNTEEAILESFRFIEWGD